MLHAEPIPYALYSTLVMTAETVPRKAVGLFNYSVSADIPGTAHAATKADTNLVRSGAVGLPQEWSMWIHGWRAQSNTALGGAFWNWAAHTSAQFTYRGTSAFTSPLLDLLHGVRPTHAPKDAFAVRLTEQQSFDVVLEPAPKAVVAALQRHIKFAGELRVTVYLDGALQRTVV